MGIRKFGTGEVLPGDADQPESLAKQASDARGTKGDWTVQDGRELEAETKGGLTVSGHPNLGPDNG